MCDSLGDLGEVCLGRGEQFFACARALAGHQGVAAHDQPLPGKILRCGDFREVLLVKQRELEDPGSRELLDGRGLQRGDPLNPVGLAKQFDVRLGDHPAIGHDDDL